MRKKQFTQKQREIIEDYLPYELSKNKKLDDGMKLVLANIYKQHYIHQGVRTVFRTNMSFKNDIDVTNPVQFHRPLNRLISKGFVERTLASEGKACEYTLTDVYYVMLPECLRISKDTVSDSKDTVSDSKDTKDTLEEQVEIMLLEISELKKKIEVLETRLSEVSKDTVSDSKDTTINNKQTCVKLPDTLITRYNPENNKIINYQNVNVPEPVGDKKHDDSSFLIFEESGQGPETGNEWSKYNFTEENVERCDYWERRISDFGKKKLPNPEECGIVPIDNSDLERIACWMKDTISDDAKLTSRAKEYLSGKIDEALSKLLRAA